MANSWSPRLLLFLKKYRELSYSKIQSQLPTNITQIGKSISSKSQQKHNLIFETPNLLKILFNSISQQINYNLLKRSLLLKRRPLSQRFLGPSPALPTTKPFRRFTFLLLPFPLKLLHEAFCEDVICPDCSTPSLSKAEQFRNTNCNCPKCAPPTPLPASDPPVSLSHEPKEDIQNSSGDKTEKNLVVPWNQPSELSHPFLIRQASQLTVDSVTRLLGEFISAYQDYHSAYRRSLDAIMELLEASRIAVGLQTEVLDCKIIIVRARVDEMKANIVELESFLYSLQTLSDATAGTAFLAQAEYHAMAMAQRFQSVVNEMKRIKEETLNKEREMIQLQSLVIVESGKSLK